MSYDLQLLNSWKIEITNQKKKPDKSIEIENVIEYSPLNTLREIFQKLSNISISTLGFYTTISLKKYIESNQNIENNEHTIFSIVNLPDIFSTTIFIKLMIQILDDNFPRKELLHEINFVRQGLNYSVELDFCFNDFTKNPQIILNLSQFIDKFRSENDLSSFDISIDVQMRPIQYSEQQCSRIQLKNTFDSAFNVFLKNQKY